MKLPLIALILSLSACSAPVMQPGQPVSLQRMSATQLAQQPASQSFRFTAIRNLKADIASGQPFVQISVEYELLYTQPEQAVKRKVAFNYHKDKRVTDVKLLAGDRAPIAQITEECAALMRIPLSP